MIFKIQTLATLIIPFAFCCLSMAQEPDSKSEKRLVVLGDSLTEGLGVSKDQAFPSLLQIKINDAGKKWKVVNAGISGATTAGADSRLKWLLKAKIDLLIIALGANDGLRGFKANVTQENLSKVIQLAHANKVSVVLVGMQMPPNYGDTYRKQFAEVFINIEKKHHVRRVPFLLDKVAGNAKLNQADGMHPNEKGHQVIAETVYQGIKDLL